MELMEVIKSRRTPATEINQRITKLQEVMQLQGLDGAIIVQNIDLFYYTGTIQNSQLFIPAEGKPVLLVRRVYQRAKEESPLENIQPLTSLKKLPELLAGMGFTGLKKLGFELDVLPYNNVILYQQLFPGVELWDISPAIRNQRAVKSAYEIEILKRAGQIHYEVFRQVPEFLKAGITEVELAGKFEAVARAMGHQGLVRIRGFNQDLTYGCCVSGADAAVAGFFDGPVSGAGLSPAYPNGGGQKRIVRGQPVILDYSGIVDGYIVDQTRIFSVGPVSEKLRRAHREAVEIQEAIVEIAKPGTPCGELYDLAANMAEKCGLADHFQGYKENQVKFVGHGVGLELDEMPVIAKGVKTLLEPGMVFALEPKFVFPGEGVVGIENTFVVTPDGVERLTLNPDELVEI
ncbi:MAG: Xaa-Pro peptidase family protein [Clostridia bacterium]|nr:Xaa-Pro peptidase family protein [Clostridia bacterium]